MNDFFRFFISGRISGHVIGYPENSYFYMAKLLQKSEMRKDIVIELSYKGFG